MPFYAPKMGVLEDLKWGFCRIWPTNREHYERDPEKQFIVRKK